MAGYTKSDEKENSTGQITVTSKGLIQYEGENKSFTDKQELREFSTTKSALQQMLKDHL